MSRYQSNTKAWVGRLGVSVLAVIALTSLCGIIYGTRGTATITVTDKEVKRNGDTSKYLIFTEGETYECTDTIWYGKFDSSDMYGKFKREKRYQIEYYGIRFGFLSWYRNIISMKEVTNDAD